MVETFLSCRNYLEKSFLKIGTKKAGGLITYSLIELWLLLDYKFKLWQKAILPKSKFHFYLLVSKIPVVVITIARIQTNANGGKIQDKSNPAPKVIRDVPRWCFNILMAVPSLHRFVTVYDNL